AERAVGARAGLAVRRHEALRESERAAGLHDFGTNLQPFPDAGGAQEVDRKTDGDEACNAFELQTAAETHRIVREGGDETAMGETARIGVRGVEPGTDEDGLSRIARPERLPWIGEGALSVVTRKTL